MVSLRALKATFREHPLSRGAYRLAADRWSRLHVGVVERLDGRYYTAARLDRIFAETPDPWSYVGNPIAEERRRLTLDSLPRARYRRLLEVGCAEGWMTEILATRADEVVSVDISQVALERAKERCRRFSHVHFACMDIAVEQPLGAFDAIVCCGVLVLVGAEAQARIRDGLVTALLPGGDLILENQSGAHPGTLAGRDVEEGFRQHADLSLLQVQHVDSDEYDIAVFRRV
jgi:protein-L-isoaspartate O-methyltransferase